MDKAVRVGIAGLGRMGRRHAENLAHRVSGAALVAACGPVGEERAWAEESLDVPHTFSEYAEMLALPEIDAVFLVTPTTLHAQQIIDALHAGKHVFCEKPLSLDLDACLRVEAEAKRFPDLQVMIGFVRRFDPSYCRAAERIHRGDIGPPLLGRSPTFDK